jgi:hypothetical protein
MTILTLCLPASPCRQSGGGGGGGRLGKRIKRLSRLLGPPMSWRGKGGGATHLRRHLQSVAEGEWNLRNIDAVTVVMIMIMMMMMMTVVVVVRHRP